MFYIKKLSRAGCAILSGWRTVYVDGAMVKPTDDREQFGRQYREGGPRRYAAVDT